MAQICKKCLLREMAEADAKMIEKYKEAIKEHSTDGFMKIDMEWAGKILFKNHNKFN